MVSSIIILGYNCSFCDCLTVHCSFRGCINFFREEVQGEKWREVRKRGGGGFGLCGGGGSFAVIELEVEIW